MTVNPALSASDQVNFRTGSEQAEVPGEVARAVALTPTVMIESELDPLLANQLKPARIAALESSAVRYDPAAIAAYYSGKPLQAVRRVIAIAWPLIRFGFSLWWDSKTKPSDLKQSRRAIELRQILTRLGPAYIKIGQALSTRPDLVPPLYLEELTQLQDQLPPFPNEIAYQFIEEELGGSPDEIYAELTDEPIAAASLGQVYKGRLKTGEVVAVKVQRPGLAENITLDLYLLRKLAAWAKQNIKRIRSDLVAILDEFGARIFEEMDYINEGHNAERFAKLYGHLQDVYVPKIYWPFTARRVLTMEWITGKKLTQTEALRAQGIDARHLIDVGVQCSLRQLLEHGFFHADPHPGNLLATTDGKLAYLDFGMMSEVKPYQRYGLIQAIVHLVNRDFEGLAQDYVKLEFLTPDVDLTPIIPAFAEVFQDALGGTVAEINIKSVTDQLSALMYEFPFQVPAYYALIIRSLVTLEGIAINVDPEFKVLSEAYPYVSKRLLTDPAPELRNSLKDLLFKDGSFRWNRLENLLKNARHSQDYDFNQVLDQTLDFLMSERGAFIREYLVEEIVKSLDVLGRSTLQNFQYALKERVGLPIQVTPVPASEQQSLNHLNRIWDILRDTRGFQPQQAFSLLPRLLLKPETQQVGQQIASGLVQKVAARLIRELLLTDQPAEMHQNGHHPENRHKLQPTPVTALAVRK